MVDDEKEVSHQSKTDIVALKACLICKQYCLNMETYFCHRIIANLGMMICFVSSNLVNFIVSHVVVGKGRLFQADARGRRFQTSISWSTNLLLTSKMFRYHGF